jgi:endonuclease YncB( thermonuclease family)
MKNGLILSLILIGVVTTNYSLASANDLPFSITGTLTVTAVSDGDTIRSDRLRIRLFGIDAPERKQQCKKSDGSTWACGKAATAALRDFISAAPELRCDLTDVDRYGRLIMRCFAGDADIGAAMVRAGYALAYRKYANDYIADEEVARNTRAGLWAGDFQLPWEWRQSQQSPR